MKALVIGNDGAAHPLAWKLAQSPAVGDLYTAPGNYGTNLAGANVDFAVADVDALAAWAQEQQIDLVVVASPPAALYGAVEACREAGLRVVGAPRPLAMLESSRSRLLAFLSRHGLPTPRYAVLDSLARASAYLRDIPQGDFPLLLSAERPGATEIDLALAGDCETALEAARQYFGAWAGGPVQLVVEHSSGEPEYSLVALSDGTTTLPVGLARTYRRAFDLDTGPLVRGMGAYAPLGDDQARIDAVLDRAVTPFLAALAAEGEPYAGPLCVEVRGPLRDPLITGVHFDLGALESHVLLPRWEDDLYVVLDALADTALADLRPFRWSTQAACAVVVASEGFPGAYETGYGILGLGDVPGTVQVFHLGTRSPYVRRASRVRPKVERESRNLGRGISSWIIPGRVRGKKVDTEVTRSGGDPYSQVITAAGTVLSVVGKGKTLAEARTAAYRGAAAIVFTGRWWRTDIAADAAGS